MLLEEAYAVLGLMPGASIKECNERARDIQEGVYKMKLDESLMDVFTAVSIISRYRRRNPTYRETLHLRV